MYHIEHINTIITGMMMRWVYFSFGETQVMGGQGWWC
jgi:hypothetical protein